LCCLRAAEREARAPPSIFKRLPLESDSSRSGKRGGAAAGDAMTGAGAVSAAASWLVVSTSGCGGEADGASLLPRVARNGGGDERRRWVARRVIVLMIDNGACGRFWQDLRVVLASGRAGGSQARAAKQSSARWKGRAKRSWRKCTAR